MATTWQPPCGCVIVQDWPASMLVELRDYANASRVETQPCAVHASIATPEGVRDAVWEENKLEGKVRATLHAALAETHRFTTAKTLDELNTLFFALLELVGHTDSYRPGLAPTVAFNAKRELVITIPDGGDPVKAAAAAAAIDQAAKLDPKVVTATAVEAKG